MYVVRTSASTRISSWHSWARPIETSNAAANARRAGAHAVPVPAPSTVNLVRPRRPALRALVASRSSFQRRTVAYGRRPVTGREARARAPCAPADRLPRDRARRDLRGQEILSKRAPQRLARRGRAARPEHFQVAGGRCRILLARGPLLPRAAPYRRLEHVTGQAPGVCNSTTDDPHHRVPGEQPRMLPAKERNRIVVAHAVARSDRAPRIRLRSGASDDVFSPQTVSPRLSMAS